MIRVVGALLASSLVALTGCDKTEQPKPAPSASAASLTSAAPTASVLEPPAPVAKDKAWAAGTWSGSYEAQRYLVEAPKNEGAREWAQDDGGAHSGDGSIELEVSDSGAIKGSAHGPLGDHDLSGQVDDDAFRVRFVPKQPGTRAFGGVAVLKKDGAALKGRLQASSGDSLTVRDAAVELHRAGDKTAASAAPSAGPAPKAAPSSSSR